MQEHKLNIEWHRKGHDFSYDTFSRAHTLTYENGVAVEGTSSLPLPGSSQGINPEELVLSALLSCHMMTFLAIAAKKRLPVDSYNAQGKVVIEKNEAGRFYMSQAFIYPKAVFSVEVSPSNDEVTAMHEKAHQHCTVANSLKARVTISPVFE